eukprot:CAMPEP_0115517448 /NCGR_PEP_ID=MMETSP0271-20121206/77323_1 /TAXON_ID=71861 /ORGANISM="Scrippsiella trochoidea, Strain CCMP3099" /LENGTH=116 /DNA_ID=CAMNT_0002948223 /DNA_START=492 /DNA_END=843 /DNA_ORIENTATION=+
MTILDHPRQDVISIGRPVKVNGVWDQILDESLHRLNITGSSDMKELLEKARPLLRHRHWSHTWADPLVELSRRAQIILQGLDDSMAGPRICGQILQAGCSAPHHRGGDPGPESRGD